MTEFLLEHKMELVLAVMALIKVVVNLTPSEKDNQVFGLIDNIINAIVPNRVKKTKKEF
jgi:hypothetical protein